MLNQVTQKGILHAYFLWHSQKLSWSLLLLQLSNHFFNNVSTGGDYLALLADLVWPNTNWNGALMVFDMNTQTVVFKHSGSLRSWATIVLMDPYWLLIGGSDIYGNLISISRVTDFLGTLIQNFNLTYPRLIPTCVDLGNQQVLVTGGFKDWSKLVLFTYNTSQV